MTGTVIPFHLKAQAALAAQIAPQGAKGSKKQKSRTPVEAKDNLRSRAYARILDLISEGPIVGLVDGFRSIYLNGTPVQNEDGTYNFKDMVYEATTGEPDQDYLALASSTERENDVNSDLKKAYPYVFTVDNLDVDALRIKFRVPALLVQNISNGDTSGTTVEANIWVKKEADPDYTLDQKVTITGKTTNQYEKEVHVALYGPGPWRVKIERLTPDSTTQSLQNDLAIGGYTEIIYAKLRYPYTAMVGMSFDAEQFGAVPERGFEIKGMLIKVPTNYDPNTRAYNGIWDGTFKIAWSNNPAWCYYDMLTNARYGLGKTIKPEHIDSETLYEIARYCDELVPDGLGGLEPRFTCNVYIQTRQQAYQLLKNMASTFRAMVFWSGAQIIASQDRPQLPVWKVTNASVIEGTFNYSSTSLKTRHTVCYVAYNNPDDMYKLDRVCVEADDDVISQYGVVTTEITAWGCTSKSQAMRLGKWLLYTEQFETDLATFSCSLESLRFWPGCVIEIADELRAGFRDGGRVKTYDDGYLVLDHPIDFDPTQSYTLGWMSKDGRLIDRAITPGTSGSLDRVYVGGVADSDLPVYLGIWTVSSSSMNTALYRVVSITEETDGAFSVVAVEHHPGKFDLIEKGIAIDEAPRSRKANPVKPTGLQVTDELYISGEALKVSMQIAVNYQPDAYTYTFAYRGDSGNWTTITTDQPSVTVADVLAGNYDVRVHTTNILKLNSDVASGTFAVLGKTRPPANVTGLKAELTSAGITLSWDEVPDLDLDKYEIREGSSWDSGVLVGTAKATTISWVPPVAGTSFTFHIRALDTSGNYSALVTSLTTNFQRPAEVESFSVIQVGSKLRWKWTAAARAATYEVRVGETFELGEPLFTTQNLQYEMEWGRLGQKYFWIKGVDYIGNTSEQPYFSSLETAQPSGRNSVLYYDLSEEGWPGSSYHTVITAGGLQLEEGVNYGEFYYQIDLGKTFRSIVTLDYNLLAVAQSNLTWEMMNYSWESSDAAVPWVSGGDFNTIDVQTYISIRTAIPTNVIVSFRLNGDLVSEDDLLGPTVARSIEYAPSRYAEGAYVRDTSFVRWQKNLPVTFSMMFTVKVMNTTEVTGYLVLANSTDQVRLLYYPTKKELCLDTTFNDTELSVPLDVRAGDLVVIGLSQSGLTGTRNLFAQRLGYDPSFNSVPAATVPAFTDVALSGHFI